MIDIMKRIFLGLAIITAFFWLASPAVGKAQTESISTSTQTESASAPVSQSQSERSALEQQARRLGKRN